MNVERLVPGGGGGGGGRFRYERMPARGPADDGEGEEEEEEAAVPERRPEVLAASASFRLSEAPRVFEELPRASIVAVSRPDAGDITPMLLSYTIEVHCKQFRWRLYKKASQVLYLHFALKRREFLEEFHEKQEQVKEWLQNLGIGEHMPVGHDEDEADDVNVPAQAEENSIRHRNVPSSAVLPVIRPALGRQHSVSDRAKVAMQEYLNHFLGNLDIVNSPEVWVVLKPGFLALLKDPFDPKLLDVLIFDALPHMDISGEGQISLAKEIKERNPLHFGLQIFITGWWLCPELFLRRPFQHHGSSRLDALLEARAKQGVQIYILLYKEVALALKINSLYSKQKLLNIHENVKVLRYPDHFSSGVYLWSHHEKIVIVDNQVCYLGGLDLCFGRYDNSAHKLSDVPPVIWPGKDYYNPRESEPNSWEDTMKDELDRTKYPRMPWHDVQCALYGPPCRDVARHFVQRWNYAKRNKAPNEQGIPLLMPHHHMVIPHYKGISQEINSEADGKQNHDKDCDVKKPVSVDSRESCQDIPLLLPQELEPPALPNGDLRVNDLDANHSDHLHKTSFNQPLLNRKAKLDSSRQDLPMRGFVDNISSLESSSIRHFDSSKEEKYHMDKNWWEMQERGDQVASVLDIGQVGPRATCHCQVIRSVGQWSAGTTQIEGSIHNAYFSLIEKAEHFVYIENQFFISGLSGDETIKNRVLEALYRRILRAEREKKRFKAIIIIPLLPGFQGGIDDGGAASVRAIMHWQYRTICRGPNSILQNLYDVIGPKAHDYISFYGLRAHGRLCEGGPLVTNQIYVHSKLMIIDDRITLIGSANINDRSLLGSRDSEIAVVIEDKEVVSSKMNGKPWEAGKFSLSLRLSLWAEHLGLHRGEVSHIMDPIDDSTFKNIWMATAKTNTMIYQDVFSCVPNDLIHSRAQFRQSFAHCRDKIGHSTIDLGVAQEKLETYQDGDLKGTDPIERLQMIKGHLVSFPLDFMSQEDLRPYFSESEYYTSPQVFH
uniref:Phospholipase n=1 Tax=Oryza nivara TaxID=4536 RepID=A0A0E0HDB8_ORYNI